MKANNRMKGTRAGLRTLRTTAGQTGPKVTVSSKVPGGPWFIRLVKLGGPQVELGPYENPALAREDSKKLQQFLALLSPTPAKTHIG